MLRGIRTAFTGWLRLRYWLEAQPMSLLSESEKRDHIRYWQRVTGHRIFVETGTFLGKTTLAMVDVFEHCYTIEYDRNLYERANVSFASDQKITSYHGDSGKIIGSILANLNEPAIFWLDAHYSGGITGRASIDTPIEQELCQILRHPVTNHVILIDDARMFVGRDGYPRILTLRRLVNEASEYSVRLRDDIIRIYRDDI